MNNIPVFAPTATLDVILHSNGLGSLNDAVKAEAIEELNKVRELNIELPLNSPHLKDIQRRAIIAAKAGKNADAYPYRVYDISKTVKGTVQIKAEGIDKDLAGYPVTPFSLNWEEYTHTDPSTGETVKGISPKDYLDAISAHALLGQNELYNMIKFDFEVVDDDLFDLVQENIYISKPCSIRSLLGDGENGLLRLFSGEYDYRVNEEHNTVTLIFSYERGYDRDVVLRYGRNLLDAEIVENTENMYTGVYPFWFKDAKSNNLPILVDTTTRYSASHPNKNPHVIYIADVMDGSEDADVGVVYNNILALNLTKYFNEQPNEDDLKVVAKWYIRKYNIGFPIEQLSTGYIEDGTDVRLGDTVTIHWPDIVSMGTMRCNKIVYDLLQERNTTTEFDKNSSVVYISDMISELESVSLEEAANAIGTITHMDTWVGPNPATLPPGALQLEWLGTASASNPNIPPTPDERYKEVYFIKVPNSIGATAVIAVPNTAIDSQYEHSDIYRPYTRRTFDGKYEGGFLMFTNIPAYTTGGFTLLFNTILLFKT